MLVTIPYDSMTFLDVRFDYDVIATGGPPEPSFGIKLKGWQLVFPWRINPDIQQCVEEVDECQAFDDFLSDYYEMARPEIVELCREFELTSADGMV